MSDAPTAPPPVEVDIKPAQNTEGVEPTNRRLADWSDITPPYHVEPRAPKVGDTLLFFHSGYTSGPYKGRACLIVEDEGGGRYGVQIFKNAADRREGVKDRAVDNGYVSGVLFCADAELQPNRRGTGWRWPANGNCFIAWETPAIAGIGQADDEDMSDASVRGPVKGPGYVMPDTCACGGQNGRHLPNCPVRLQQKLAPTVVQPPAAPNVEPARQMSSQPDNSAKPMPLPPGAKPKKASGLELTQERDKVLERGPVVQTRRTGGAVGSFRGGNL